MEIRGNDGDGADRSNQELKQSTSQDGNLAMKILRSLIVPLAMIGLTGGSEAQSPPDGKMKIGLLLDMGGPYADIGGSGSVVAARMAVEDFGGKVLGQDIEVIFADHQNKPDIAAEKARDFFDNQAVDVISDVAASAPSLAVVEIGKSKNKPVLLAASTGGTSKLTNENCSPISVHWSYSTQTISRVLADAMVKQGAGESWFFITADYAFGHSIEQEMASRIKGAGGTVVGSVRHPMNAGDMSSYVLQAQASGAKVIALANSGTDTINTIKTASEFGIATSGKQSLVPMLLFLSDIHSLGLQETQSMLLPEAFYWNMSDDTRAWSNRFFARTKRMPTSAQAAEYSAVGHYLKAVAAAGTKDTAAVMAKMRELPVNDIFAKGGRVRIDGAMAHPMYLVQVKSPENSKGPWDYLAVKAEVPADRAFQPLSESLCPLVVAK